jgi:hypothetical protein
MAVLNQNYGRQPQIAAKAPPPLFPPAAAAAF